MKKNCLSVLFYVSCFVIHPIKGTDDISSNRFDKLTSLPKPTQRLIYNPRISANLPATPTQNNTGAIAGGQSDNPSSTHRRKQLKRQGTRRNLNVQGAPVLLVNATANVPSVPSVSSSTNWGDFRKESKKSAPIKARFDVQTFIAFEYSRMENVFHMQEPRSLTKTEIDDIRFLAENLRNFSLQNSTRYLGVHSASIVVFSQKLIICKYQTNQGEVYTIRLRPQNFLQKSFNFLFYSSDKESGQTVMPLLRQGIPLTIEQMQISLEPPQGGLPTFWNNISLIQYLRLRSALTYINQKALPLRLIHRLGWVNCSPQLLSVIRFIYMCYRSEVESVENLTLPVFMDLYKAHIQTTLNKSRQIR
ncbi:MAG: hypothetical protein FJX03_05205 [Alphaproteobacteria bacterium]|nr:hypothetical protein [Alphaproteobacteria bacterium]